MFRNIRDLRNKFSMASILNIPSSSDSEDDVDYVPPTNGAASDSSCNEEVGDDERESFDSGELKRKKTKKSEEIKDKGAEAKSDSAHTVDEKQRAKDLWASFLSDVETVTPKKSPPAMCKVNMKTEIQNETPKMETKPVSVFEFAGETVVVDKDLNTCDSVVEQNISEPALTEKAPCLPKKRGIDSVLSTIMNKNKKLTVLQKTALDWSTFKKDQGLDNELEKVNKGKQGFIERQRFLERSDLRSFEMEKSMRQTLRKK